MRYLIINGPNLNLLGSREPDVYGDETLHDIQKWLSKKLKSNKYSFQWIQSNHEGEIIDFIHDAVGKVDGIVINPGALTHYSYSIRDAISSVDIPTVEVHLSDINKREAFRKISVIKDVCIAQISGLGKNGYLEAVHTLEKKHGTI
tara:strand:+ start:9582 stop:10019 length:438 start_codon:yes stop_codon:yes gene_type:complete